MVKLLSWYSGAWTVEANGRRWHISMTNVDPGQEFYIAADWWHGSHPMVRPELAGLAKWTRCGKAA